MRKTLRDNAKILEITANKDINTIPTRRRLATIPVNDLAFLDVRLILSINYTVAIGRTLFPQLLTLRSGCPCPQSVVPTPGVKIWETKLTQFQEKKKKELVHGHMNCRITWFYSPAAGTWGGQ